MVIGGATIEADAKKDIILGVAAMALGVLLPFLGIALAGVVLAKGLRQSRKLLVLFGAVAIVTTAVGVFIYVQIYRGMANKSNTSSQAPSPNAEEANPDGFDSLGIQ